MFANIDSAYLRRVITSIIHCVTIFFIILLSCFLYDPAEAVTDAMGKKIVEEKCTKCHGPDRIYSFKRTLKEWTVIIQRMHEKDPAWLTDKVVESVSDFVKRNYVNTGKDLFESLCVHCHVEIHKKDLLYQPKTRQLWANAIERMRRKYVLVIGIAESELIKEFWTDPKNNKNLKLHEEDSDISRAVFENKCGRCHTYNFMYGQKRTMQDWLVILNRMQKKSPIWIDSQNLKQIERYIFSKK